MVSIILALVLVGFALYLLTLITMDPTIAKIIRAVIILFAVLYVLAALGLVHLPAGLR